MQNIPRTPGGTPVSQTIADERARGEAAALPGTPIGQTAGYHRAAGRQIEQDNVPLLATMIHDELSKKFKQANSPTQVNDESWDSPAGMIFETFVCL